MATREHSIHSALSKRLQEGGFLLLTGLSLFMFVALITYNAQDPGWSHTSTHSTITNAAGGLGAWFADFFLFLFGYVAYLIPILIGYGGYSLLRNREEDLQFNRLLWVLRCVGFVAAFSAAGGLCNLHFSLTASAASKAHFTAGGILGQFVSALLHPALGGIGTSVLLIVLFLAGITLTTGLSWFGILDGLKAGFFEIVKRIPKIKTKIQQFISTKLKFNRKQSLEVSSDHSRQSISDQTALKMKLAQNQRLPLTSARRISPRIGVGGDEEGMSASKKQILSLDTEEEDESEAAQKYRPIHAALPALDLLDVAKLEAQPNAFSHAKLEALSKEVESKLLEFGIAAAVVAVLPGPVITRFELELGPGLKVSKITALSKDLARALSVIRVRVVEVIPGKSVVGLEIPNEHREVVQLREILESDAYQSSNSPLTLALGKDIAGVPVAVNLAKMPHLLVAGTTGSGKSVGINAMLLSLLYKATPEEVRLILIDPKMLELSVYDGIPHLLTPVVTDMKDASTALRWCVAEMERRYQIMAAVGVRNLVGYNRKLMEAEAQNKPVLNPLWRPEMGGERPALERLPYIVVIIDEFADMIMVVGKKVEELIARIAQKARAAGIHMILATQRPSVDVITGLIKANVPTRIAFQVSSRIDSRTILDQQGAEQLLGYGDMLYLPPGTGVPMRVHGAFVADEEVHKVVKSLKQLGEPDYAEDILGSSGRGQFMGSMGGSGFEDIEDGEQDELYDQAVQIVTESRKASISHLQRRLKIGYNRAARLVETMETAGLVSALQSNGGREVLVGENVDE